MAQLPATIATACRIMAVTGLVEHILGHISVRVNVNQILVRCRGPQESGLVHTTEDDIKLVPGELDGWTVPNELPIHTELLRRRSELTAVVHAHPPAVVTHSLLDQPLVAVYGAYDIPGARLAADGIPVWERSALINTAELAGAMADALGGKSVVVLRGHGLVSVAEGPPEHAVRQAVLQAVAVDALARTHLRILNAGGVPRAISDADLAALPDLGGGFNVETMWRNLTKRLDSLA